MSDKGIAARPRLSREPWLWLVGCLAATFVSSWPAPGSAAGGVGLLVWLCAVALGLLAPLAAMAVPWAFTTAAALPALATAGVLASAAARMLTAVGLPLSMQMSRLCLTAAVVAVSSLLAGLPADTTSGIRWRTSAPALLTVCLVPVVLFHGARELFLGDASLRMASLIRSEDAAAWLSAATWQLRTGMGLPATLDPAATAYMQTAVQPGLLAVTAVRGLPTHAESAVPFAVDAVFASWLLAAVALGLLSAFLVVLVSWRDLPDRRAPAWLPLTLGLALVQVVAYSAVLSLTESQHLTLAWAGVGLLNLAILMAVAIRSVGTPALVTSVSSLVLAAFFAANTWPFDVVAVVSVVMATISYLRWTRAPGSIRIPWALGAVALGLVLGGARTIAGVVSSDEVGGKVLLAAQGTSVAAPNDLLLGAAALVLACLLISWRLPSDASVAASSASLGAATGSLVVLAARLLEGQSSSYAQSKSTYLLVLVLPAALCVLVVVATVLMPAVVSWGAVAVVGVALLSQPLASTALDWVEAQNRDVAYAARVLGAASSGLGAGRAVCIPTSQKDPVWNYLCQRWVDSFAGSAAAPSPRQLWLTGGDPAELVRRAQAEGFLRGVHPVDTLFVLEGAGDPAFTDLSELAAVG